MRKASSVNTTDVDDYVLQVSNLNVTLQNQPILENISFRLKRGMTLALVGPNGAGKTILFKTLLGLVPYAGKIDWKGKVKIGYVPQNISVSDIPISVKEFLSIKNPENVKGALKSVRLDGADIASKSLSLLSGGQLRRALVAWAIIDDPNLLLLDEPTIGVDADSEESVYRMLTDLVQKSNMTMMLISHDIHIVREYSHYMLAMNKCVTFFGESKEIMKPDVQRTIYGEVSCKEIQNNQVSM